MIDYDIQDELKPNLSSDEKLIWTGRPKAGIILRGSDAFLVPFSILWGGFAIFWEATAITMGAPFFFWLFGIPFVLVGLYITIGRFYFDAKKRARTIYGITPGLLTGNTLYLQMDQETWYHILSFALFETELKTTLPGFANWN